MGLIYLVALYIPQYFGLIPLLHIAPRVYRHFCFTRHDLPDSLNSLLVGSRHSECQNAFICYLYRWYT